MSSPDAIKAVADRYESGLCIDESAIEDIVHGNFERRVGKAPKAIDKDKFKAYIEKYSFAVTPEEMARLKPLMEKYL